MIEYALIHGIQPTSQQFGLDRKTVRRLTHFKHRITNALSEGFNGKMYTFKLMACGYRNR